MKRRSLLSWQWAIGLLAFPVIAGQAQTPSPSPMPAATAPAASQTPAPAAPAATKPPGPAQLPPPPAPAPTQTPPRAHPDFQVKVSGQGRPVLFIAGLATPGDIWQPTVDQLHGAFQVHLVSLAGFGTVPPTGTSPFLPKVRDELIAYIVDQKLDHPVIVGHSLGGFLALWIAIAAPHLPGRLVIVDALPYLPALLNPTATTQSMRTQMRPFTDQMSNSTQAEFTANEAGAIDAMVTRPEDAKRVAAMAGTSDPKTCARAMLELMTIDLRPDLHKIQCPVLVLAALADKMQYATRDMVLADFQKQYETLAGVRIEGVDDARHFIMIDDLPVLVRALEGELKDGAPK